MTSHRSASVPLARLDRVTGCQPVPRDAGCQPAFPLEPAHPSPRTMEEHLADAQERVRHFSGIAAFTTGRTGAWAARQLADWQARANEWQTAIEARDAWRAHVDATGDIFTRPFTP